MSSRIVYRQADAPLSPPIETATPTRDDKLALLENYVRETFGHFGKVKLRRWCAGDGNGIKRFVDGARQYEPLARIGFPGIAAGTLDGFRYFFDISERQAHHIVCRSAYYGDSEHIRGWRMLRHIRQVRKECHA